MEARSKMYKIEIAQNITVRTVTYTETLNVAEAMWLDNTEHLTVNDKSVRLEPFIAALKRAAWIERKTSNE